MFEQIKLVNHIQTAVQDHHNCLWSVGCHIVPGFYGRPLSL